MNRDWLRGRRRNGVFFEIGAWRDFGRGLSDKFAAKVAQRWADLAHAFFWGVGSAQFAERFGAVIRGDGGRRLVGDARFGARGGRSRNGTSSEGR